MTVQKEVLDVLRKTSVSQPNGKDMKGGGKAAAPGKDTAAPRGGEPAAKRTKTAPPTATTTFGALRNTIKLRDAIVNWGKKGPAGNKFHIKPYKAFRAGGIPTTEAAFTALDDDVKMDVATGYTVLATGGATDEIDKLLSMYDACTEELAGKKRSYDSMVASKDDELRAVTKKLKAMESQVQGLEKEKAAAEEAAKAADANKQRAYSAFYDESDD